MNGPPRLLDASEDDFQCKVLQSAEQDIGSDAGFRRTLAAIGAGAAMGSVAAASAAASIASGAKAAGAAAGSATVSGVWGTAILLKWVGLGMMAGAVSIATVRVVSPPRESTTSSAAASFGPAVMPHVLNRDPGARAARAPSASVPAESVSVPSQATQHEPRSAPLVDPPRKEAEPAGHQEPFATLGTGPFAVAEPSRLQDEVVALDSARQAITNRSPAAALQQLDNYHRQFPAGIMGHEALVLRVQALLQQGNRAAAADLACRFVASQPASPHAAVLRRLVPDCSVPYIPPK